MNNEYTKLRDAMLTIMNMNDVEFNAMLDAADNLDNFAEVDDTIWSILASERDLRKTDGFVCRTVEQLEYRGLFESV